MSEKWREKFLKAQDDILQCFLASQPTVYNPILTQFTIIHVSYYQNMLPFKKVEEDNLDFKKKSQISRLIEYQNS